ncbi:hypothetical protein EDC48_11117 [Gibbsiella quercinecans]|nr:hypothetical protein EDC48_11117 [Gibbsiella quercinecans]
MVSLHICAFVYLRLGIKGVVEVPVPPKAHNNLFNRSMNKYC